MTSTTHDNRVLERTLKAFANKRRLAIVQLLKQKGELSVTEIARQIRLSVKATSKHLGILFGAEILEREQRSILMYYRISDNMSSYTSTILSFL